MQKMTSTQKHKESSRMYRQIQKKKKYRVLYRSSKQEKRGDKNINSFVYYICRKRNTEKINQILSEKTRGDMRKTCALELEVPILAYLFCCKILALKTYKYIA